MERWKGTEGLLRELRFDEGKVLLKDERFFLGHKYMLDCMHSTFEAVMGPAARAVLYRYGETVGYHFARRVGEKWNISRGRSLLNFFFRALTWWDFGKFSDVIYDPRRRFLKVAVEGSIEISSLSGPKKPSCYFVAGLLGGLGKYLFGEDVICRERTCEAVGDAVCEFVVESHFR